MTRTREKVNRTEFAFFSSTEESSAKEANDLWVRANEELFGTCPGNVKIAAYFSDDEDAYVVTIIRHGGKKVIKSVYSWDELSELIHDEL